MEGQGTHVLCEYITSNLMYLIENENKPIRFSYFCRLSYS